jgi:hypothetical protein
MKRVASEKLDWMEQAQDLETRFGVRRDGVNRAREILDLTWTCSDPVMTVLGPAGQSKSVKGHQLNCEMRLSYLLSNFFFASPSCFFPPRGRRLPCSCQPGNRGFPSVSHPASSQGIRYCASKNQGSDDLSNVEGRGKS